MTPENREKAIAWLQDEIRSLRLAPTINGCDMKPEWAEQLEIMETCLEAVKGCFVGVNKTSPLTLNQLREMDGQPVWIHTFSSKSKKTNIEQWALVASAGKYSVSFIRVAVAGRMEKRCEEYGKTWLAYAYQPAHIDREAWTAEWKRGEYPSGTHYLYCSKCGGRNGKHSMFCPDCGRAITPEAWAELEKRLRGQQQKPLSDATGANPESSEKDQVRISSSKGPDGLQIYIGFKCGKMEKDISFMFDKQDPSLGDICKFLSQQLTELVQNLSGKGETKV